MALEGKQQQRRGIGGAVHQLGRSRGVEKVVAQPAHEQEHQKAARARAEKTIVKPQQQRNAAGSHSLGAGAQVRHMVTAQFFLDQRIDQHRQQHGGQGAAQKIGRDAGDQPGAAQRTDKPGQHRRQHAAPTQLHAPAVLPGGHAGAPDRGALVDTEQRGGVRGGKGGKQGRHQDQATTANDGIDKSGEHRGQGYKNQFHGAALSRQAAAGISGGGNEKSTGFAGAFF